MVITAKDNVIGLAMGLDTSSLKAGLQDASRRLKETNAEFRASTAGMDDWASTSAGLNAKLKQLNSTLDIQEAALKMMEKEYDDLYKGQDENSAAATKLRTQILNQQAAIGKTKKELNKYEQELKDVEASQDNFEDAVEDTTKSLKKQDKQVEASGEGFDNFKGAVAGAAKSIVAGLGAAVAGAVTSFFALAESTREYREDMGKLETAFASAGKSTELATKTYKNFYSVLGEEDRSVEAVNHLAKFVDTEEDMAKWTDICAGVWGTFGDSLPIEGLTEASNETAKVGKVTGVLADALNWAGVSEDEFQASLDACATEQERAALITNTLNGLYSEASDTYKEVNKDVMDARLAQSELTDAMAELGAIAEPIMTTLKFLAADLLRTITPFVELMGEGLKAAFEGTAGAAELLAEGIGGILDTLVKTVTDALPTVLGILVELVPSIVNTLLAAVPDLLDVVLNVIIQVAEMLSEMLPQIIEQIVDLLPEIIDSLVEATPKLLDAATQLFMSLIDAIPIIINRLIFELPKIINLILSVLQNNIPVILNAAVTLLMSLIDAIPVLIEQLLIALPGIIDTILSTLISAIPLIIDAAIMLLMSILDALPVIIDALVENLPLIINTIIDSLISALPVILQAAVTLLMAIIQALPVIIDLIINEFPRIVTTIINTLLSRLPDLIQAAVQLLWGIIEAIPQIIVELVKQVPKIATSIIDSLKDGLKNIKDIGVNLLKGIWNGISDAKEWLKKKIKGVAESITGWFKDIFDINSPSVVMKTEVGQEIGEGVGVGIEDSIGKVKKKITVFNKEVLDGFDINPNINALNGELARASGSVVNNNFTQIVNTPKAPALDDMYRLSGNLLNMKAVTN